MALDLWEQLRLATIQREVFAADAAALEKTCVESHNKRHILECSDCYSQLLKLLQTQYLTPRPETSTWFSERKAFLNELDGLLKGGMEFEVHYQTIDDRIEAEKRLWMLETLSSGGSLTTLAESTFGKAEFRAKMSNRNTDVKALLAEILAAATTMKNDIDPGTERLYQTLANDQNEAPERLQLIQSFLTSDGATNTSKMQEMAKRINGNTPLEQILLSVKKNPDRVRLRQEMEKQRHRIMELKRAKAGHEAQKMKAKGGSGEHASSVTQALAYPCAVCSKPSEPGTKQKCCALCWVEAHLLLREDVTAWCSVKCINAHYASHRQKAHPCESGSRCVSLVPQEDHPMSGVSDSTQLRDWLCKECSQDLKTATRYCSERCAAANFMAHREGVHLRERSRMRPREDDTAQLRYHGDEKGEYSAKDILEHIKPYDEVVADFKAAHQDWTGGKVKVPAS